MLKKKANRRAKQLDQAIAWCEEGLAHAPEGSLLVDKRNGRERYFWRKTPHDKKGTYLKKNQIELIKRLAQKSYEKKLLKEACAEKASITALLDFYSKRDAKFKDALSSHSNDVLTAIYDELPEQRKQLVTPFMLGDKEYADQWQAQTFSGNAHPFGSYVLFTGKGEAVRSKSEVIIADALAAADIPYHYEKPLHEGLRSVLYPDFTILNIRTRNEFIWEHFGLMDDQVYRDNAIKKLGEYTRAGYLLGKNLIVTFETANAPLDTRVVNTLIQHYLM